ncbi:hypothetical protein BJ973_002131 [Actinoplanes tereljensis]|uniref:Uncharacterized protein n=1 Tax=Paractinoplanes tereljensis TaxID=571912 RepID=A0A919NL34_9ACTN|nr:hypothetical protein [Actinoplanes tereljensis]GIF19964.1 hypothetical protein Ate02nite_26940 [Actinoplanes tereljensis]
MTLIDESPAGARTEARRRRRPGIAVLVSLVVALVAGGALLVVGPAGRDEPATNERLTAEAAWPKAVRADFDPAMPDGPLFAPLLFLDTASAIGTAPTPDAGSVRLGIRDASGFRQLRSLPLDGNPQFEAVAAAGDDIVWTESTDGQPQVRIWHASRRDGPAKLLTADTGNAIFFGNQFDLSIGDGLVRWAAANGKSTEVRSVPLGGGTVAVHSEPGNWSLSAWPWLVDENERRLRNLATNRDTEVVTSGPEAATCSPAWCRVTVMTSDGVARIDLMHPDGSARRRIAGGDAQAAVDDVAVLDRFELLAQPGPDSDLTGTTALLVYDAATSRTVDVTAAADGAFTGGGLLWWSTGGLEDDVAWHVLDLRTV